MNLDKCYEAYLHDPAFHNLIELLMQQIVLLEFTPSEIKQAATFACILIEQRTPKQLYINQNKDAAEDMKE